MIPSDGCQCHSTFEENKSTKKLELPIIRVLAAAQSKRRDSASFSGTRGRSSSSAAAASEQSLSSFSCHLRRPSSLGLASPWTSSLSFNHEINWGEVFWKDLCSFFAHFDALFFPLFFLRAQKNLLLFFGLGARVLGASVTRGRGGRGTAGCGGGGLGGAPAKSLISRVFGTLFCLPCIKNYF